MPAHPEVTGALALMVFQYSRRNARIGPDGSLITLEAQARSRWVQSEIDEGQSSSNRRYVTNWSGPTKSKRPSPPATPERRAPSASETDWGAITDLYTQLEEQMPSSVVRLNRAVAAAMAGDPDTALAIIEELSDGGGLERYY
jgi:RNA polymerase sigma-70 factor (ECF subfamily)